MARLHEYQGKAILAANGFRIPRGRAASTADDAVVAARDLVADTKGGTVVIKIQAWTTGRAGMGGVAFAKKTADVRGHAARMIDTAQWSEIRRAVETHSGGLIVDRGGAPAAALASEEVANKDSELLACDVECRLAGVEGFYLKLDVPGLGELIGSAPALVEKK